MYANHPRRPFSGRGDARDRNTGRVSDKDAVLRADGIESLINAFLDLPLLGHVLDDELRLGQCIVLDGEFNAAEDVSRGHSGAGLAEQPLKANVLRDPRAGRIETSF